MPAHAAPTLSDALRVSDPRLTDRLARLVGDGPTARHARHGHVSPVSWSDRHGAYVWTVTGSPLTFDQCERRGLDGTGRTV